MTFLEAIKTELPLKRKEWPMFIKRHWKHLEHYLPQGSSKKFMTEDYLADDWEVLSPPKPKCCCHCCCSKESND